jgi:hypothetical protein
LGKLLCTGPERVRKNGRSVSEKKISYQFIFGKMIFRVEGFGKLPNPSNFSNPVKS